MRGHGNIDNVIAVLRKINTGVNTDEKMRYSTEITADGVTDSVYGCL